MTTINLTDEDLVRLEVIAMDEDQKEAYNFIKERIIPEIKRSTGMKMCGHLDGGKGGML